MQDKPCLPADELDEDGEDAEAPGPKWFMPYLSQMSNYASAASEAGTHISLTRVAPTAAVSIAVHNASG